MVNNKSSGTMLINFQRADYYHKLTMLKKKEKDENITLYFVYAKSFCIILNINIILEAWCALVVSLSLAYKDRVETGPPTSPEGS